MPFGIGKNFSDMNPVFYAISTRKGIVTRHVKDAASGLRFATKKDGDVALLPNVVSTHKCRLIKTGKGIDPRLQENKAVNIALASASISGMIIHPGETFSFWRTVGDTTARRGYKDGRVIVDGKLRPGIGGGLCNLGNTVNLLVLHSPLQVTEFHKHSDALSADHGPRVPLSAGTSVSYNYIDYRFKNTTDQDVQLVLWTADGFSYGELRSQREFPYRYEISEEGHHFQKEGDAYYRVSRIYKDTYDKVTGKLVDRELIWNNHSQVMFDPAEIPQELLFV